MPSDKGKQKEMSFWDHFDELRGTLFRSVLAIIVFSIAGLCFKNFLFDNIILAPANNSFFLYRLFGWQLDIRLINTEVSAQFFVHLKASVACGIVAAFPYILFELWKFLRPALYEKEVKAVRGAFLLGSILFYIGVVVGYCFVLPVCLQFFSNYVVSSSIENAFNISSYMSMFTSMVLLIGILFEFPSLIVVLSRIGIVTRKMLRKGRPYALVVLMILSAIITPSDPFSMLVLTIPLYGLYEFSIFMCKKDVKSEDDIAG